MAKVDRGLRRRRRLGLPRSRRDEGQARCRCGATSPTRGGADDPATGPVENGYWTAFARGGDSVAGRLVLGGETCAGNAPTAPDTVWCRRGNLAYPSSSSVTYDVNEPVVSWAVQCVGPTPASVCFTGDGAATNAHLHLQSAVVTVDDPVAPATASGLPGDGVRRTNEIFTASATDSAGVRSLRVLVDGVARVDDHYELRLPLRRALRRRPRSRDFDLAGVPDGRHTVTTIAEDAASNVTRTEQDRSTSTAPPRSSTACRSTARTRHRPGLGRRLRASRAAPSRCATAVPTPFVASLKTTLRTGRLTATVPRSISMSRLGIRALGRRPRRQRLLRRS